jgi:hypothetical protein
LCPEHSEGEVISNGENNSMVILVISSSVFHGNSASPN